MKEHGATGSYFQEFCDVLSKPLQCLIQTVQVFEVFAAAVGMWVILMYLCHSESPIVVVISGSMEPGFYRGDILLLDNNPTVLECGQTVVFQIPARPIPIVHRVIETHEQNEKGVTVMLTKGDNNQVDDRGLYDAGAFFVSTKYILGRVVGYIPHVGMVTILINDYPLLKYGLFGLIAFSTLIGRQDDCPI